MDLERLSSQLETIAASQAPDNGLDDVLAAFEGAASRQADSDVSAAADSAGDCMSTSESLVSALITLLAAERPQIATAACAALGCCAQRLMLQPPPWWVGAAALHANTASALSERPWLLSAAAEIEPDAEWMLPGAVAAVSMAHCETEGAAEIPAALHALRPALPAALRAAMAAAAAEEPPCGGRGGVSPTASSAAALLLAVGRMNPGANGMQVLEPQLLNAAAHLSVGLAKALQVALHLQAAAAAPVAAGPDAITAAAAATAVSEHAPRDADGGTAAASLPAQPAAGGPAAVSDAVEPRAAAAGTAAANVRQAGTALWRCLRGLELLTSRGGVVLPPEAASELGFLLAHAARSTISRSEPSSTATDASADAAAAAGPSGSDHVGGDSATATVASAAWAAALRGHASALAEAVVAADALAGSALRLAVADGLEGMLPAQQPADAAAAQLAAAAAEGGAPPAAAVLSGTRCKCPVPPAAATAEAAEAAALLVSLLAATAPGAAGTVAATGQVVKADRAARLAAAALHWSWAAWASAGGSKEAGSAVALEVLRSRLELAANTALVALLDGALAARGQPAVTGEDRAAADAAISALTDFVSRPGRSTSISCAAGGSGSSTGAGGRPSMASATCGAHSNDGGSGGTGDGDGIESHGADGLAALAGHGAAAAGLASGLYSAFAVVQLAVSDCAAFCEQSAAAAPNEVRDRVGSQLLRTPEQMTAASLAVLRFHRFDASPGAEALRPADAARPDLLKAAVMFTGLLHSAGYGEEAAEMALASGAMDDILAALGHIANCGFGDVPVGNIASGGNGTGHAASNVSGATQRQTAGAAPPPAAADANRPRAGPRTRVARGDAAVANAAASAAGVPSLADSAISPAPSGELPAAVAPAPAAGPAGIPRAAAATAQVGSALAGGGAPAATAVYDGDEARRALPAAVARAAFAAAMAAAAAHAEAAEAAEAAGAAAAPAVAEAARAEAAGPAATAAVERAVEPTAADAAVATAPEQPGGATVAAVAADPPAAAVLQPPAATARLLRTGAAVGSRGAEHDRPGQLAMSLLEGSQCCQMLLQALEVLAAAEPRGALLPSHSTGSPGGRSVTEWAAVSAALWLRLRVLRPLLPRDYDRLMGSLTTLSLLLAPVLTAAAAA